MVGMNGTTQVSNLNVYALDDEVVAAIIKIRKNYKTKQPDALIAATALVNDFILITRNTSDFKNISHLNIVDAYNLQ